MARLSDAKHQIIYFLTLKVQIIQVQSSYLNRFVFSYFSSLDNNAERNAMTLKYTSRYLHIFLEDHLSAIHIDLMMSISLNKIYYRNAIFEHTLMRFDNCS